MMNINNRFLEKKKEKKKERDKRFIVIVEGIMILILEE
jgi:hypothetical protein